MESGCTNPSALGGGSASLHAYLTGAGSLIVGIGPQRHRWVDSGAPIETPFVSVPGLLSAQCVTDQLGTRLEVSVLADSTDGRTDNIPGDIGAGTPMQAQWGLHLIDVNLVMGDLIDLVKRQSETFRRK